MPGSLFAEIRGSVSEESGLDVFQTPSNLDNPDALQVSEVYWAAELSPYVRTRVGVLDANAEFAALAGIDRFFQPSVGTTPTLPTIPTWPLTAPGAELVAQVGETPVSLAVGGYARGSTSPFVFTPDRIAEVRAGEFFGGEIRVEPKPGSRLVAGCLARYEPIRACRWSGSPQWCEWTVRRLRVSGSTRGRSCGRGCLERVRVGCARGPACR